MLSSLCALLLFSDIRIDVSGSGSRELFLLTQQGRAPTLRQCPKYKWDYLFSAKGFGQSQLRFRLYAQSQKTVPLMLSAGRTLLRLWDIYKSKTMLDNPMLYDYTVDVFLADGGKAGGEQGIFAGDDGLGVIRSFNTIYIYQPSDFNEPIEMLREVAHEYGHAVLPAVGGFSKPENWGNGYLGEKLFLYWLLRENKVSKVDIFGASQSDLAGWVSRQALTLSDAIWKNGINQSLLKSKGPAAMNEYIGLMLFVAEAFPEALPRALKLSGGNDAKSAYQGVLESINEKNAWIIELPKRVEGHIWLPLSADWKVSGAMVIMRLGDWSELNPTSSVIRCTRGRNRKGQSVT